MMLNNFAASNYQLVELKVPANTTSTKFYFQDQPNLRNKLIEKIEFYGSGAFEIAPSGTQNSTIAPASFVTFADSTGNDFIQDLNIYELQGILERPVNSNPASFNGPFTFKPRSIVFTKSFVSISAPNPGVAAASICFGVYYK